MMEALRSEITKSVAVTSGRAPEPRLAHAARQFEAMMMKELLEPLSRAGFDDANGSDNGVLGEFASESLAGALSAGRGFGIAERIEHALSGAGQLSGVPAVIGEVEKNTRINARK